MTSGRQLTESNFKTNISLKELFKEKEEVTLLLVKIHNFKLKSEILKLPNLHDEPKQEQFIGNRPLFVC